MAFELAVAQLGGGLQTGFKPGGQLTHRKALIEDIHPGIREQAAQVRRGLVHLPVGGDPLLGGADVGPFQVEPGQGIDIPFLVLGKKTVDPAEYAPVVSGMAEMHLAAFLVAQERIAKRAR